MAASELTQRCWAIAESLGEPISEAQKVFQAICDEMLEVPIERHWAIAIAGYVGEWKKTKNPYYVDLAFMLLADLGGVPTETMAQEDIAARRARFYGAPIGTPDSIQNECAERATLMLMANLVIRGAKMGEAAKKAASYYHQRYPRLKRKKASTLEVYYSDRIRKSGIERHLQEVNKRSPMPDWDRQWLEISEAIPDCPEELIGNARD